MKSKISRRSFLRNIAAAGSGAATLGLLAGCSSSSTAASSGSTAAAEDKYTPGTYSASKTISYSEIGVSMTFDANSITACEITSSGEQDLLTDDKKTAMAKAIVEGQSADVDAVTSCTLVASVGAIQECVADCIAQATGTEVEKPETTEVTGRVPGYCGPGDWLGEAPADPDKYEDAGTYDVVIVGGGHAGVGAAFGAVDEGATVAVIEKQPWGNFVDLDGTGTNMGGWYGEDIGHVNSKLLIERGYGPYDTGAITSEFCKRAAGRVNPEIIKNFVQYSGQMFDRYEEILAPGTHHLSTIPNTPVAVCEGIVVCERRHSLSEAEWQSVQALLSHVGLVVTVDTAQLGIAGTVCGCGPAFVAMFIEALADAAVKHGIVRADAYRMASQMVVGTGKLQLATGQHPAVMKDAVCSPGGTTIVGVGELERKRFRGAVIDAIDAIQDKK